MYSSRINYAQEEYELILRINETEEPEVNRKDFIKIALPTRIHLIKNGSF